MQIQERIPVVTRSQETEWILTTGNGNGHKCIKAAKCKQHGLYYKDVSPPTYKFTHGLSAASMWVDLHNIHTTDVWLAQILLSSGTVKLRFLWNSETLNCGMHHTGLDLGNLLTRQFLLHKHSVAFYLRKKAAHYTSIHVCLWKTRIKDHKRTCIHDRPLLTILKVHTGLAQFRWCHETELQSVLWNVSYMVQTTVSHHFFFFSEN